MLTGFMRFRAFFAFPVSALLLLLAACSSGGVSQIRTVQEFNQKQTFYQSDPSGLSRSQSAYVMYGALSEEEKKARLGQYYTVYWDDNTPDQSLDIVFDYQQAATGSKILTRKESYPAGRDGGSMKTSFDFIGEPFLKQGRVMTWRATLQQHGKELSRRSSYLWQDERKASASQTDKGL